MRLVLSGGGTGGHILPNIALIHELREQSSHKVIQTELLYIGTRNGMERQLMKELDVPYVGISTGKLRRYFSLQNVIDFFKIPIGFFQALFALRRFRPDVIFCKGGYVCFPVAVAGKCLDIPVVLHEADVSPGLANRLSARFASTICVAFEESKKYFPGKKVVVTGNPVRRELALGNKEKGLQLTGLNENKSILLFMGGSLGADFINHLVWRNLSFLLQHFQVVHICGQGKIKTEQDLRDTLPKNHAELLKNYRGFTFVGAELKHLYAASDLIICRSGALTLAEIDFVDKPSILIPLPRKASRGDQIENAEIFAKTHACVVIPQEDFEKPAANTFFIKTIEQLIKKSLSSRTSSRQTGQDRDKYVKKFAPLQHIIHLLESAHERS